MTTRGSSIPDFRTYESLAGVGSRMDEICAAIAVVYNGTFSWDSLVAEIGIDNVIQLRDLGFITVEVSRWVTSPQGREFHQLVTNIRHHA